MPHDLNIWICESSIIVYSVLLVYFSNSNYLFVYLFHCLFHPNYNYIIFAIFYQIYDNSIVRNARFNYCFGFGNLYCICLGLKSCQVRNDSAICLNSMYFWVWGWRKTCVFGFTLSHSNEHHNQIGISLVGFILI